MEMREAIREKEEKMKMRQKMRERVQPKMGKLTIDYQKLHDAFFKYQTKPEMTGHGEVYYEGKEFEPKYKDKRPGELSAELKVRRASALVRMRRHRPSHCKCPAERGGAGPARACRRRSTWHRTGRRRGCSTCSATARRLPTPACAFPA